MLVLNFFNAFNTIKWAIVFEEVAIRAPTLTQFVAKCCGDQPAIMLSQVNTSEPRNISSNTGIHLGHILGQALFYAPEGTILHKFRDRFESNGDEPMAHMKHMSTSCLDINSDTVQAVTFLKEKLKRWTRRNR